MAGAAVLMGLAAGRGPAAKVLVVAAAGLVAGLFAGLAEPPLSLTWAALIGLVIVGAFRPAAALLALVAVLMIAPFAVIPLGLAAQPPIFDLGLAAVLLASAFRIGRRGLRDFSPSLTHWLVACFLAAGAASTLIGLSSGIHPEQLQYAAKLGLGVAAFFLAAALAADAGFSSRLAGALVFAGAVESLLATGIYALGEDADSVFRWLEKAGYPPAEGALRFLPDGQTLRAVGTAVDPNVLGATLAVAFVIGLAVALSATGKSRWLWWAAVIATIPGLALSLSRGSWLAAGAGALTILAFRKPALAAALLVAAIAVLVAPVQIEPLEHLRLGLLAREPSAALRLDELDAARGVIAYAPVFGVGFPAESNVAFSFEVSNVGLWIAERTGLLGASLYAAAAIGAMAAGLRRAAGRPIVLAFTAALIAAVVSGLVDHQYASMPHLAALFWILAGSAVGAARGGSVANRV